MVRHTVVRVKQENNQQAGKVQFLCWQPGNLKTCSFPVPYSLPYDTLAFRVSWLAISICEV
ncbi:rCG28761 [Rattus norvegicus]|uniref:RCG28761 n=1 Tax=Rattus norvegicus TaxID=10116 RepID=A6HVF2_RAT|nr:rCG28761 [Rattus norvegicus]